MKQGLLGLLLLAGVFVSGPEQAQAHPHVWITASSQVIYAPDGSITGVRHAWTFDDMFSTYALQGIETKVKGVYSREELAPLAQTNVENLKEFGFFTFAKADGKKQKFSEPVDYYLEYKDDALTLHFMLPAKAPFKAKQTALEVFDDARKHELMVSGSINELYARATSEKDYATQVMLQWFITEQVEEEKTSTALAERLRLVGDSATGLIILDRQLGERTRAE